VAGEGAANGALRFFQPLPMSLQYGAQSTRPHPALRADLSREAGEVYLRQLSSQAESGLGNFPNYMNRNRNDDHRCARPILRRHWWSAAILSTPFNIRAIH
jgi:hypothetical protein